MAEIIRDSASFTMRGSNMRCDFHIDPGLWPAEVDRSQIVSDLLGRLGYESKCVADGREALDAYGRARTEGKGFDAVIMDLTVPGGMGGREVASRILELDPEARTVVSSGYLDDPIMAEYRDHGFMGVVAKPYDIGELSRVLAQVVGVGSK